MTDYERHVAKIRSTFLGVEDHGIFTAILYLDFGSSSQGAGTYSLDHPSDSGRRGTAEGMDFIMRTLRACGVDSWEKLPGRTIYALKDPGDGWSGLVRGIEPLPTEPGERFIFADAFPAAVQS